MKKVFLLIIGICSVFMSCSKEDSPQDLTFLEDELVQTTWKGKQKIFSDDDRVIFLQEFYIKFQDETHAWFITTGKEENERIPFEYKVKDKMLYLYAHVRGNWTLIKKNKKLMVLQDFLPQRSTLTLEKID